ncbi:MAG: hypothetical protein QOI98_1561 [Solirubrobacteraceae bacterium]|jgi:two-component sensor histidine kinase|nr:hypothetical protein [Solirubrobacteraceae bacterium]
MTALAMREVDLVLPLAPDAARSARSALVSHALDPDLEHSVCLLVTELVTNGVRHSGGRRPLRVRARLEPGRAWVEVEDGGRGFHPDIRHGASGFGLRIVDRVATRWGVEAGPPTRVWFVVER